MTSYGLDETMTSLIAMFGPDCTRFERMKRAVPMIGLSRTTIYRLIGTGDLKAKRIGHAVFVDMGSAIDLFERSPSVVPEKHTRSLEAADLGLDEPKPFPGFRLGRDDLAAMAPDDSETARDEPEPLPGRRMPVAQGNAHGTSAEALSAKAPSFNFFKVP
jgi:hypothetical protein